MSNTAIRQGNAALPNALAPANASAGLGDALSGKSGDSTGLFLAFLQGAIQTNGSAQANASFQAALLQNTSPLAQSSLPNDGQPIQGQDPSATTAINPDPSAVKTNPALNSALAPFINALQQVYPSLSIADQVTVSQALQTITQLQANPALLQGPQQQPVGNSGPDTATAAVLAANSATALPESSQIIEKQVASVIQQVQTLLGSLQQLSSQAPLSANSSMVLKETPPTVSQKATADPVVGLNSALSQNDPLTGRADNSSSSVLSRPSATQSKSVSPLPSVDQLASILAACMPMVFTPSPVVQPIATTTAISTNTVSGSLPTPSAVNGAPVELNDTGRHILDQVQSFIRQQADQPNAQPIDWRGLTQSLKQTLLQSGVIPVQSQQNPAAQTPVQDNSAQVRLPQPVITSIEEAIQCLPAAQQGLFKSLPQQLQNVLAAPVSVATQSLSKSIRQVQLEISLKPAFTTKSTASPLNMAQMPAANQSTIGGASTGDMKPIDAINNALNNNSPIQALRVKKDASNASQTSTSAPAINAQADITPTGASSSTVSTADLLSNGGIPVSHPDAAPGKIAFETDTAAIGHTQNATANLNALLQQNNLDIPPQEQVVQALRMGVRAGQAQITMQLKPESLGQINMTLTSNASKEITAKLIASTPEAKAALENNLDALSRSLAASGISVNKITVVHAAADSAGANNERFSGQQQSPDDNQRQPQSNAQEQSAWAQNFSAANGQHNMSGNHSSGSQSFTDGDSSAPVGEDTSLLTGFDTDVEAKEVDTATRNLVPAGSVDVKV